MSFDRIPTEIKTRPQWVAYRPDKTPVDPKTGRNAKANDPDTWGTFEEAVRYYQDHQGNGIAGIGYAFSFYDPLAGMDIDACRNPKTGELSYCARVLLDYMESYSEASTSNTGAHSIVKAKWPEGASHKKAMPCGLKIEVYDKLRYFTVTGLHIGGTPTSIEDRQVEIEALHREIFPQEKQEAHRFAGPSRTLDLSDAELIDRAHQAANGGKFSKLWRGDWSDYPSQSEADLALCELLAFWTAREFERIEKLFGQSELNREKWQRRPDYRIKTIKKAIANTTEFYTPGGGADPNWGNGTGQAKDTHKPGCEKQGTAETDQTVSLIPVWPHEVMTGVAGAFAKTYSKYLETPASFLFMNFLTMLGHLVSDKVTLKSEISPQPRLYLVNLGESADTRKSTSIFKVANFFLETIDPDDLNLIMGVGSAEGLAKALGTNPRGVLINDELKQLVNKMRIDTSVLLPCVCTLFELNTYRNQTKKHDIKIDNAQLCLLAASTRDTYQNIFSSQFMDIGFINRLFIVIGDSQRKFAIPKPIPEAEKETIRNELKAVSAFWRDMTIGGRFEIPIESLALDIFEEWYFSLEQSVFTKRLDTYGHRLMVLLAVNEMKDSITPEIAERTISLLNYQLAARKFADPIDADNAIARVEERIRRALASGNPMKKRDLERTCSKNRVGNWIWTTAIKNLRGSNEVGYEDKQKVYWLIPE